MLPTDLFVELLRQDCWPLAITSLVSSHSEVPELRQQHGLFFFSTPNHDVGGDISSEAIMQYIKDRLAHKPVAPLYTNTLLGFYEGLQHTAAHSTAAHSGTQRHTAVHSSTRQHAA